MELIKKLHFSTRLENVFSSLMKFPDKINLWSKFYY